MEVECQGVVLSGDRPKRRISALTPEGLWHFSHPNPTRRAQGKSPMVFASALNPLCLSQFSFTSRSQGWGWLRQAQLLEALWPTEQNPPDGQLGLLERLRAGAQLRQLILLSQQPACPCPLLFQLLVSSLRQLVRGELAAAVQGVFAVKLLIHEGLWPQPLHCQECSSPMGNGGLEAGAWGLRCVNCANRGGVSADRVEFDREEIPLLEAIGYQREWAGLRALNLSASLAERAMRAAKLLILAQRG